MKIPEILLGSLLTVAIFCLGYSIGGIHSTPINTSPGSDGQGLLGLLIGGAAVAANVALWLTALGDGRKRSKDLEITQRAYLSVEPDGINPFKKATPSVVGHVRVRNTGHLPAKGVATVVYLDISEDRNFVPPPADPSDLSGSRVIQSTASIRQGSETTVPVSNLRAAPGNRRFLYVWGRVQYDDGFGKRRYTNFCHRYNTASRSIQNSSTSITTDKARYHDDGNDAD